jgi:hypothetical protein
MSGTGCGHIPRPGTCAGCALTLVGGELEAMSTAKHCFESADASTFASVYRRACEVFGGSVCLGVQAWRHASASDGGASSETVEYTITWFPGCHRREAATLAGLLAIIEAEALPKPTHEEQLAAVVAP